ncbi:hypothetical protein [Mycobacteroides abscessus]|uniref:hypothetical protein n=1 Tax=Mycobacteroides abscessus TaxID=36809 RepID=UPI0005DF1443|nr:hypothetical protein [Mycobacteroides abscessus]CPR79526.1 Uncharacterised protein [Mycobacteroides abscessus]CPR88644.1 Uncharacterised protein [Mycobacteroides abscessus]CPS43582.1 Uncharacterised protein [Mycobacteroides abscessus]CPV03383.1 Uncharacterised protein [Mycobacteroides abscessus]
MTNVDMTPESDIDVVAARAHALTERIRDDDPRRVHKELTNLCQRHPAKAAQIIMALAAWIDPDEGTLTLIQRAESVTKSRIASGAHRFLAVTP